MPKKYVTSRKEEDYCPPLEMRGDVRKNSWGKDCITQLRTLGLLLISHLRILGCIFSEPPRQTLADYVRVLSRWRIQQPRTLPLAWQPGDMSTSINWSSWVTSTGLCVIRLSSSCCTRKSLFPFMSKIRRYGKTWWTQPLRVCLE